MLVQLQLKADYSDPGEEEGTWAGEGRQSFSGGQKAGEGVEKRREDHCKSKKVNY